MKKGLFRTLLLVSFSASVFLSRCTKEQLPVITTAEISEYGLVTATGGGVITSDGHADIKSRGVCWAEHDNPLITDNCTKDGKGSGSFTSQITGLTSGTIYFVRAYATNSKGTSYGESRSFKTFNVMDFDNNGYHSVKIGTQEWMAENLKTGHFQNGDIIRNVTSETEWTSLTQAANCSYNNSVANMNTYGCLYNFYAVKDSRNICPAGWHVPVMDEWNTLIAYLGGSASADVKLREAGISHWTNKDTGADNSTGFTLLPAGDREPDGKFFNLGSRTDIWSSLEHSENGVVSGWLIGLEWDHSEIRPNPYPWTYGASVRCLKN